MSKNTVTVAVWIAAFFLTVALAVFQRMTGPSYPKRGVVSVTGSADLRYRLPRTHAGDGGLEIAIAAPEIVDAGFVEWRRYPTGDLWSTLAMIRDVRGRLTATVPHQPPAGKVEYRVFLDADTMRVELSDGEPVVARFRAGVPAWALIPHILAMFGSMLVSTRALLEVLRPSTPDPRRAVITAMGLLVVGGLILGPLVQKFAFGAYWTGWPFGHDLTDNKTLVAFLAWLPATVLAIGGRRIRAAVVIGWIVMMGVFLIPHSLRGSEVDWSESEIRRSSASLSTTPGEGRAPTAGCFSAAETVPPPPFGAGSSPMPRRSYSSARRVLSWISMCSDSRPPSEPQPVLLVRSGGYRCAIPVSAMRHLTRALAVHPLPGSAPRLLGLAHFSGEPLAVVDLHALLDPEGSPGGGHQLTVIIRQRGGPAALGLAVDEAYGVTAITPEEGPAVGDPVLIAARTTVDSRPVLVLDAERLFDAAETA